MCRYPTLFIFVINNILSVDLTLSVCSTKRSTLYKGKLIYYTQYSCCQNFEERRGQCFECEIGFTALYGDGCQRCPANKFGKKCTSTCFCTGNEKCNYIYGCVSSMVYSNATDTYNFPNATSSYYPTVNMNVVEQNNKNSKLPMITEACIGSVSLILVITGIICIVRRSRQTFSRILQRNTFQGNSREQPQYEHTYDEIDEQNMSDFVINEFEYRSKELLNMKCERKKTGTLTRKNDGYLNQCYCLTTETGKNCSVSCSKKDEDSLNSSTSEDDQGYQKVVQSPRQKTKDFQPSVEYFEPLDVSTDIEHHLETVKQDKHNSNITNKEYIACNCRNENGTNSEMLEHKNIQLRDSVITEGELKSTQNVFSLC